MKRIVQRALREEHQGFWIVPYLHAMHWRFVAEGVEFT